MTNDKEMELRKNYPTLFMLKDEDYPINYNGGGIHCYNGWYDLLNRTLAQIYFHKYPVDIIQIKEKLGGLRIYIKSRENLDSIDSDKIDMILNNAEIESKTICETCGKSGKLDSSNIHCIRTICDECIQKDI